MISNRYGRHRALPTELRAVIHIINSNPELMRTVGPHINVARREINWEGIWGNNFSSGLLAALSFGYSIWIQDCSALHDPFQRALSMDEALRRAASEAITIWLGGGEPTVCGDRYYDHDDRRTDLTSAEKHRNPNSEER